MLQSASRGGGVCSRGGICSPGGCLPGLGGGVSAPRGVCLPVLGGSACLVRGQSGSRGVCLPWGVGGWCIPAGTEADTLFTSVCQEFCPQGGRVSASVPPPPRTRQTPPDQADSPGPGRPPPRETDPRIRSTSGRYASYWNAFLLRIFVILRNMISAQNS